MKSCGCADLIESTLGASLVRFLTFKFIDFQQNYACFDVRCNGEGCLYPAIKEYGIDSPDLRTCSVTEGQVCYVNIFYC